MKLRYLTETEIEDIIAKANSCCGSAKEREGFPKYSFRIKGDEHFEHFKSIRSFKKALASTYANPSPENIRIFKNIAKGASVEWTPF